MPIFKKQDLWKHPGYPGLIAVTTNATIKMDGALVMGRGAALEATKRIKGVEYEAGNKINTLGLKGKDRDRYGFLIVRPPTDEKVGFGIFQVKYSYKKGAVLGLIEFSSRMLAGYAMLYPEVKIRMNYPGIGNGGLSREWVEPTIEKLLPPNITVCYQESRC